MFVQPRHSRGPEAKALPVRGRGGLEPKAPGCQSDRSHPGLLWGHGRPQWLLGADLATPPRSHFERRGWAADSAPWDYLGRGGVSNSNSEA